MDAIDLFFSRYGDLHVGLVEGLLASLPEAKLRTRPHPGVNTIVWLLWHSARIEDLAVNRFLVDSPQVLEEWGDRLKVARRDVGTGMSDAEVDDLSARIDLPALRGYWDAVTARTQSLAGSLRGLDLEATVPGERVKRVVEAERAVAPGVEWLTEFWAGALTHGSCPRRRCCIPTGITTRLGSPRDCGARAAPDAEAALRASQRPGDLGEP